MIYLASTVVLVWNSYSCVLPARVLYRPVSITVGSVIPCKRDNHGGNPWVSAQYDVLDSNLVKKYTERKKHENKILEILILAPSGVAAWKSKMIQ